MAHRKPRDPLTAYRNRNLKQQRLQGRGSAAPSNNSSQTPAKIIVIVFFIIIFIVIYMLGLFSG